MRLPSRHNVMVAPVVLFVRVPILFSLLLLMLLGEAAEKAGDRVSQVIPGFTRD